MNEMPAWFARGIFERRKFRKMLEKKDITFVEDKRLTYSIFYIGSKGAWLKLFLESEIN